MSKLAQLAAYMSCTDETLCLEMVLRALQHQMIRDHGPHSATCVDCSLARMILDWYQQERTRR